MPVAGGGGGVTRGPEGATPDSDRIQQAGETTRMTTLFYDFREFEVALRLRLVIVELPTAIE